MIDVVAAEKRPYDLGRGMRERRSLNGRFLLSREDMSSVEPVPVAIFGHLERTERVGDHIARRAQESPCGKELVVVGVVVHGGIERRRHPGALFFQEANSWNDITGAPDHFIQPVKVRGVVDAVHVYLDRELIEN